MENMALEKFGCEDFQQYVEYMKMKEKIELSPTYTLELNQMEREVDRYLNFQELKDFFEKCDKNTLDWNKEV
jgi:site-specific recombinase XerD